LATLAGCADGTPAEAPQSQVPLRHEFDSFAIDAGAELVDVCQAWALGNDEPIHVNAVSLQTKGPWHHSMWFAVPEGRIEAHGGIWPCEDQAADPANLVFDGKLLFGQSTQVDEETATLPAGAVVTIPPRSVVVGNLHVVNTTQEKVVTAATLELRPIAAAEIKAQMNPLGLVYMPLEIAPQSVSSFTVECDLAERHLLATGRPIDFGIHYVLPHYHALGREIRLEVVGGPSDGAVILETTGYGEPIGQAYDPLFDLTGATGIRLRCTFENQGSDSVGWGNSQAAEMCMATAMVDSELMWAVGALDASDITSTVETDTGTETRADCNILALPPSE
jgi:hypothetical protein